MAREETVAGADRAERLDRKRVRAQGPLASDQQGAEMPKRQGDGLDLGGIDEAVSGGDPVALADERLAGKLAHLAQIRLDHVDAVLQRGGQRRAGRVEDELGALPLARWPRPAHRSLPARRAAGCRCRPQTSARGVVAESRSRQRCHSPARRGKSGQQETELLSRALFGDREIFARLGLDVDRRGSEFPRRRPGGAAIAR